MNSKSIENLMTSGQSYKSVDGSGRGKSEESGHINSAEIGRKSKPNGTKLNKGEIFNILNNSRRRMVIRYLDENRGYTKLGPLAEHIAAKENGITVQQLTSTQRKRAYISLYQCHLPKMDSLGVIEYNKSRGTIELQVSSTQLLEYLNVDRDAREETGEPAGQPWAILAVAGLVVAVVTVGTIGLGPLAAAPAEAWTALSLVGILTIVGLQYAD